MNHEDILLFENALQTKLMIMPTRNEITTASIYFYFKVGSKNEPKHLNGISHFIEHMIFKGSPKYKSYLDISKTFDSKGISFNAFTSKDITAFHYKFLSTTENLDIICRITHNMLMKPLMREHDITTERNVIIQELNDDADDIDEVINDTLETYILDGHPLSYPIIGTLETLNNIKRKDLIEYHSRYYQPNNLLITFSGHLKSNYKSIIDKYFSSSKDKFKSISMNLQDQTQGIIQIIPYQEKYLKTTIKSYYKNLKQDYIHIIFKTKGSFDPLILHYKLIANILGGNMSSRLFVEIREKLGLVYSIKCSLTNYEEIGYFDIYAQTENKDTIKCIINIIKQLKQISSVMITNKELEENKINYCNLFKTDFDDIEYENEHFSKQILFNKPFESIDARIKKIKTITNLDILTTSKTLFNFDKMHIVTFGKITQEKINQHI